MEDQQNVRGTEEHRREPAFNLPRFLTIAIALLAAIYVIQEYGLSAPARDRFMVTLAFSPLRYVYPLAEQDLAWLWSPVSYSMLHGGIDHLVFNLLWLMAFGAPVVRRIGTGRTIVLWILSAVAAAFFHAFLNWGSPSLLIGASGVVSALMGAACRFAFPAHGGYDRVGGHARPRQSIVQSLRNRSVLLFTSLWLAGNFLIALGVNFVGADVGPIAWDAHIGGFLFGFLLFQLFDVRPALPALA